MPATYTTNVHVKRGGPIDARAYVTDNGPGALDSSPYGVVTIEGVTFFVHDPEQLWAMANIIRTAEGELRTRRAACTQAVTA